MFFPEYDAREPENWYLTTFLTKNVKTRREFNIGWIILDASFLGEDFNTSIQNRAHGGLKLSNFPNFWV